MSSISTEQSWFLLGKEASLEQIQEEYKKILTNTSDIHSFFDMVVMGATDGYMVDQLKTMDNRRKKVAGWCSANGCCPIWIGTQKPSEWVYEKSNDINRELNRLGGAGEVSKGSFKS